METVIALLFIVLTVICAVYYAVQVGKARDVGGIFNKPRKRLPAQREGRDPPSEVKTKDGHSKNSPSAE